MNGGIQQRARLLKDAFKRVGSDVSEHEPTYTLDRHIAEARARMGETRWNELQEEWK